MHISLEIQLKTFNAFKVLQPQLMIKNSIYVMVVIVSTNKSSCVRTSGGQSQFTGQTPV